MIKTVESHMKKHIAVAEQVLNDMADDIASAARLMIDTLASGNTVLLCGNGGSAADAQHFAAELSGRYIRENRRPLPAIALTTDTSALTAIGNDFGFDRVFARQVQALARQDDLLIGISTSGNSSNVIGAFEAARAAGCRTMAISGRDGGQMRVFAEMNLIVPSNDTPHIQEMHITIIHILCELIDRHFASDEE